MKHIAAQKQKIFLLFVSIFLLSSLSPVWAAVNGDSQISGTVGGAPLTITTYDSMAGAISSLTWNGVEFIDKTNHGRELQSVSWPTGYPAGQGGPTEAGSNADGNYPGPSSSVLQVITASGNHLFTQTQMAYWDPVGGDILSDFVMTKDVTIGHPVSTHIIQHSVTFHVPENYSSGGFETLTGYMPPAFAYSWALNPKTGDLTDLSGMTFDEGEAYNGFPVILSLENSYSSNTNFAMGIYSPEFTGPTGEQSFVAPFTSGNIRGGFRTDYPPNKTVAAWGTQIWCTPFAAGDYTFHHYVIVGTLADVRDAMTALHNYLYPTYTIGGTISGLSGTVVLQNNGGDNLTRSANGSFTFATAIHNGDAYSATVLTQPSGQTCVVSSGTGTVASGNITSVSITCSNNSDIAAPTVTAFTIPTTATSLTVTVTTFTATDTVGVTGYKLTESATAPASGDAGWSGSAPANYTFATEGAKTLYAWAKDAAGNVSDSLNDSVTITLSATTKNITAFAFNALDPAVTGTIDNDARTVSLTVPFGTNVTALVPTITHSGASISPASGAAQNFTNSVNYTVTAEDASTKVYAVTVTVEAEEEEADEEIDFNDVELKFKESQVENKKTYLDKINLYLDNISNSFHYKLSRGNDNFKGDKWKDIEDKIKLKLDVTKDNQKKQNFYIKFKSDDGEVSDVFKKSVYYIPKYSLFVNSDKVKFGEILREYGKNFSVNSDVALYFSAYGGGYFRPLIIKTDKKGDFSVNYKVKKPLGKYSWYAIDLKTGKKSELSYWEVIK